MDGDYRSFADPDTEFILERSDTPVTVDGLKLGKPTGEVTCTECGKIAGAPEYIPHLPDCSQADVQSRWWKLTHVDQVQIPRDDSDVSDIDDE